MPYILWKTFNCHGRKTNVKKEGSCLVLGGKVKALLQLVTTATSRRRSPIQTRVEAFL